MEDEARNILRAIVAEDAVPKRNLAEAIQRREGKIRSAIQDGTSLFEQLNFAEHVENLQAGRRSSLAFTVE